MMNHAIPLCYIFGCLIQDHMFNRNMERPPRTTVQPQELYGSYQGGTRSSRLCGEERDRETENSKVCARTRDTRFIQVRVAKVGGSSMAPCAWCWLRSGCPSRYQTLLYIVQGRVPSRLQGRGPSRITRNES
jgi:hypothetical protein